jgi:hypothetical protein
MSRVRVGADIRDTCPTDFLPVYTDAYANIPIQQTLSFAG